MTPTTGAPASANIQVTFVNPNGIVAPTVASVVPADLATAVDPATTVQVTFSEQVNPATVTAASVLLLADHGARRAAERDGDSRRRPDGWFPQW